MDRDRTRQIVTLVAIVATLAMNSLAVALPLGGMTTAQISDSFRVFVIPAGGTFAIWSVIYTLLIAFGIHQARPSRRSDPLLRRLGYLPALTCAFNAGWIVLWQYRIFVPTLGAMLGLLLTLIAIESVARDGARPDGARPSRADRWVVRLPFSVYLGWITVATILNVAVALASVGVTGFLGLAPELIGAVVLLVGIAIAVAAVIAARDVAIGLAIAWAYYGIWLKESTTPYVGPTAVVGVVAVALAIVGVAIGGRRSGRTDAGEKAGANGGASVGRPASA